MVAYESFADCTWNVLSLCVVSSLLGYLSMKTLLNLLGFFSWLKFLGEKNISTRIHESCCCLSEILSKYSRYKLTMTCAVFSVSIIRWLARAFVGSYSVVTGGIHVTTMRVPSTFVNIWKYNSWLRVWRKGNAEKQWRTCTPHLCLLFNIKATQVSQLFSLARDAL